MDEIKYKEFDYEIKAKKEDELTVQHFITTEKRDRLGDRMHADGMIVEGIPVVLLAHGKGFMGTEPVAKNIWLRPGMYKRHKGIEAYTQFFDDEQGVGKRLWQKTVEKYMPNWSLGYGIVKAKPFDDKGLDIKKWKLFEYSIVGVSMNPDTNTIKGDMEESLPGLLVKYMPETYLTKAVEDEGVLRTCSFDGFKTCYTDDLEKTIDEINDFLEVDLDKKQYSQSDIFDKSVIQYKKTPLADAGLKWDAAEQVKKAEIDDLKKMCVWYDEENKDAKGAYKGPHHLSEAPYKCVKSGVVALAAAIMGARGGINIPASDMPGVKAHIEKHYKDFDLGEAPWKKKDYEVYMHMKEADTTPGKKISQIFIETFAPEIYLYLSELDELKAPPPDVASNSPLSDKVKKKKDINPEIFARLNSIENTVNNMVDTVDNMVEIVDAKFKEYAGIVKEIKNERKEKRIVFKALEKQEKQEELRLPKSYVDGLIKNIQAQYLREFRKVIGKVD